MSTPKQQLCIRSIPGLDEECKEAQMQVCQLKKIYNQNSSVENWEEYRVARAVKRRLINKKKQNGYREYCQKACDSPKAIWQACKTACKLGPLYSYLPSIQRNDKTTTNDPKKKVEKFKETFSLLHLMPTLLISETLYIQQELICQLSQTEKSKMQYSGKH